MKKVSKKDRYYLRMLNAEAKYIAKTSGEDSNEPFITPLLFSLLDSLNLLTVLLGCNLGFLIALLSVCLKN